jgi:hypothetical protein
MGALLPRRNIVLQYGSSKDGYVSIFDYTTDGRAVSLKIMTNSRGSTAKNLWSGFWSRRRGKIFNDTF